MIRPHLTLHYTTLQRKNRCEPEVALAQFSSAARPWRTVKPVCLRLLCKHGPDSGNQNSGAHGADGDRVFAVQAARYPKADGLLGMSRSRSRPSTVENPRTRSELGAISISVGPYPGRHRGTGQILQARKGTSRARWIFLASAHRLSWRTRAEGEARPRHLMDYDLPAARRHQAPFDWL